MADQPSYEELQARAKELGIPTGGKRRAWLEAEIAKAEAGAGVAEHEGHEDQQGDEAAADGTEVEVQGDPSGEPAPAIEPLEGADGAHPEPVSTGGAKAIVHWNCSAGDLDGRPLEEINAHIEAEHG